MTIDQHGLTDKDLETGVQQWLSIMVTVALVGVFGLLLPFFFKI
jgi:hypothetical protein